MFWGQTIHLVQLRGVHTADALDGRGKMISVHNAAAPALVVGSEVALVGSLRDDDCAVDDGAAGRSAFRDMPVRGGWILSASANAPMLVSDRPLLPAATVARAKRRTKLWRFAALAFVVGQLGVFGKFHLLQMTGRPSSVQVEPPTRTALRHAPYTDHVLDMDYVDATGASHHARDVIVWPVTENAESAVVPILYSSIAPSVHQVGTAATASGVGAIFVMLIVLALAIARMRSPRERG